MGILEHLEVGEVQAQDEVHLGADYLVFYGEGVDSRVDYHWAEED